MYQRIDQIAVELPEPKGPSPNSASAVQELMGGRFGEMSTLMNYTFQSFNFRGRSQYRPFYDLIANIAAEELGHIEVVAYTVNLLLNGASERNNDPSTTPLGAATDARNHYHFIASGQSALPIDSHGNPWNGSYVFNSGNLKLDLLHNFFLEVGARANKIRVYQMVDDPTARKMVGYLLVRGGTHAVAYARALEKLTGVELMKLFPIPDISNDKFPETREWQEKGYHNTMFTFSPNDYREFSAIWNGKHPDDGSDLVVSESMPEGFTPPDLPAEPQINAPSAFEPGELEEIAKRLFG